MKALASFILTRSPGYCLLCFATFLFLAGSAFAAPVHIPNIGQALQEAETARPREAPRRQQVPEILEQEQQPMTLPSGETLFVRQFVLVGAEYINQTDLLAVLAPYTGRDLTLAQIEEAAGKVTALYRERGYLVARTYIPRQDASSGKLTLQVVVGKYGEIGLQNNSHVRDFLLRRVLDNLKDYDAVRQRDIERNMLIVADMPGAQMPQMSIAPGQAPGTSDFVMDVPAENRFGGYLLSDNYGSRYTGRWRFSGGLDVNSPLGIADKLSLYGMTSEDKGLLNFGMGYSLPLAANGLRLDFGISRTTYELGDDFRSLDATGKADTIEAGLSYPIIRSRDQNLYITLNGAAKRLRDEIEVFDEVYKKRMYMGTLGLKHEAWGSLFDRNLFTRISGGISYGHLGIPDEEQERMNERGADTVGNFAYLTLGLSANYALSELFSLNIGASLQKALGHKNLDGSEQFSITGPNGVKAYREVVSGDNGYLLNAELRFLLPAFEGLTHSIGVFGDTGRWEFEKSGYATKKSDYLSDIGVGYYASYKWFMMNLQLAHAVGPYPEELRYEGRTHLLAQFSLLF